MEDGQVYTVCDTIVLPVSYQKSTLETYPSFLLCHCCKCEERYGASGIFPPSLYFHLTFYNSRLLFPLLPESIWNAASFYQESSYLYFPTLQAELASDISFYFKTSAPSGVFLENLGLKDFIRLELSCESNIQTIIRAVQHAQST